MANELSGLREISQAELAVHSAEVALERKLAAMIAEQRRRSILFARWLERELELEEQTLAQDARCARQEARGCIATGGTRYPFFGYLLASGGFRLVFTSTDFCCWERVRGKIKRAGVA